MSAGTPYHWVLTVSGVINGRPVTIGDDGLVLLPEGFSRAEVFADARRKLLEYVSSREGAPVTSTYTVFWSLEPDRA